jgi:hypothetical protein
MTWNNWREKAIKKYPDIEQEYQTLSLKKSLLHFALEQKAILPKEYLSWAQKEFQLPMIKNDFKPTEKNKTVWNAWSSLGSWNQSCIPFYEWDQCLYVLSLEPFSQTKIKNHQVISILSSPEKINELWGFYHSDQSLLLDSYEDTESETSEEEEVSENNEMPEGFGSMPSSSNSPMSSDEDDFLQTKFQTPFTKISMEAPTQKQKPSFIEEDEDAPPSTQLIDLKTIAMQMPLDDEDEVPPSTKIIDLTTISKQLASEDEDVPPSTQRIDLAQLGMMPSAQPKPAKGPPPNSTPGMTVPRNFPDYYMLDALQKKYPQDIHGKLDHMLQLLSKTYKNTVVFCVNKAETECQIFKLDSTFHPEINCSIELKSPSIFRIIQKTGKSFHGALAPSKMNNELVQKIYAGRTPENITSSPILVSGIVVGYILCSGPLSTYNRNSLALCEDLTLDFSRTLERISHKDVSQAS